MASNAVACNARLNVGALRLVWHLGSRLFRISTRSDPIVTDPRVTLLQHRCGYSHDIVVGRASERAVSSKTPRHFIDERVGLKVRTTRLDRVAS